MRAKALAACLAAACLGAGTLAPAAPVSYFRLQIFGGKKGLIINSRNICRGRDAAWVGMRPTMAAARSNAGRMYGDRTS